MTSGNVREISDLLPKVFGVTINKALIKVTSYNKIPDVILKIFTRRSSFQSVMKTDIIEGGEGVYTF